MFRKLILCALASAAMIPAMALAHPGGGGGGAGMGGGGGAAGGMGGGVGVGGGMGGGLGSGGGMGGGAGMGNMGGGLGNFGGISNPGRLGGSSDMGSSMRDQGRLNSQGPAHASDTGIAHANSNSVLAGTSATTNVRSGALAGLTTGTTLYSNGTAVGTVQQIRTTGNGSVAVVLVKGANGGMYAVPANKLTFASGTLSTTARFNGINGMGSANVGASAQARANSQGPGHASATGIAHANYRSVLGSGSASTLTGVTVGMPLLSNGTQVGTVYRVVTANGTIQRVLVQGTNGRIYSLAPSTLTAANGSLTTTAMLHGL